jgi:hypothetical protein
MSDVVTEASTVEVGNTITQPWHNGSRAITSDDGRQAVIVVCGIWAR